LTRLIACRRRRGPEEKREDKEDDDGVYIVEYFFLTRIIKGVEEQVIVMSEKSSTAVGLGIRVKDGPIFENPIGKAKRKAEAEAEAYRGLAEFDTLSKRQGEGNVTERGIDGGLMEKELERSSRVKRGLRMHSRAVERVASG